MKLIIVISDEDTEGQIVAAGAQDMIDFHLPAAGIKADSITVFWESEAGISHTSKAEASKK